MALDSPFWHFSRMPPFPWPPRRRVLISNSPARAWRLPVKMWQMSGEWKFAASGPCRHGIARRKRTWTLTRSASSAAFSSSQTDSLSLSRWASSKSSSLARVTRSRSSSMYFRWRISAIWNEKTGSIRMLRSEVRRTGKTHQVLDEGLIGVEELLVRLFQGRLGLCQRPDLFGGLRQGGAVGVDEIANVLTDSCPCEDGDPVDGQRGWKGSQVIYKWGNLGWECSTLCQFAKGLRKTKKTCDSQVSRSNYGSYDNIHKVSKKPKHFSPFYGTRFTWPVLWRNRTILRSRWRNKNRFFGPRGNKRCNVINSQIERHIFFFSFCTFHGAVSVSVAVSKGQGEAAVVGGATASDSRTVHVALRFEHRNRVLGGRCVTSPRAHCSLHSITCQDPDSHGPPHVRTARRQHEDWLTDWPLHGRRRVHFQANQLCLLLAWTGCPALPDSGSEQDGVTWHAPRPLPTLTIGTMDTDRSIWGCCCCCQCIEDPHARRRPSRDPNAGLAGDRVPGVVKRQSGQRRIMKQNKMHRGVADALQVLAN